MKRGNEPARPYNREHLELVRAGSRGVWWQDRDGLQVQLAAAEREPRLERGRLSFLAILIASVIAGRERG